MPEISKAAQVANIGTEIVSVKDFGAVGDGVTDDTGAFNSAIAYLESQVVDTDFDYVGVSLVIPPGVYSVSSVNFTNLRAARNIHIQAYGAVLVANTAGKPVIDAVGSRWLWFHGLTIYSPASVVAEAGIQLGPVGTETCGNNKFFSVQCLGDFSRAPVCNYGSETTQYYSCRFANNSSDASSFAYIGDGAGVYSYTSDYATVTRALNEAVSFTNNSFYSCQMRHTGAGQSVWLSGSNGWQFDQGCYMLCFTGSSFSLYSTSTIRHSGLIIKGLCETTQSPGLDYIIRFTGDGTTTALSNLDISLNLPHHKTSFFKNDTGSTVRISHLTLSLNASTVGSVPLLESSSNITLHGSIRTREGVSLNLDDAVEFSGDVFANDIDAIGLPPSGGYTLREESGKSITVGQQSSTAESWVAQSVSANAVTVASKYVTLNEASPSTVNDINATYDGISEVVIRNAGSNSITFTNNTAKLRNNSGSNVVLGQHQSIRYAFVSGSIWQEV